MLENAGRFIDRHTMVWMRKLDVPVARVWEAVSTKQGLDKWWMCPVEIDLRPGGAFSHHWENTITDYKDGTRFTGHYTDGQMDGTFTGYYADDGILEQTFQMGKKINARWLNTSTQTKSETASAPIGGYIDPQMVTSIKVTF